MSDLNFLGWLDLSGSNRPCYSLICEQAAGGELVKYKGVWMTKKRQTFLKRLNPTLSITKLPYELRRDILEHDALDFLRYNSRDSRIPVYLRGVYGPPTAIKLPAVTKAGDRKLRLEAIHVTLNLATIEIHSGPANARLQKWLASIDLAASGNTRLAKGFDVVRSLLFPYFSRFPHGMPGVTTNNDIELMKKCGNLRSINVQWVNRELCASGEPKTVDRLRREYRLDGMLELKMLEILTLDGPSEGLTGHAALQDLAKWFQEEFKQKYRKTEVTVV